MPSPADINRQHAQTVRRLLTAESAAVALIKPPVSAATARVQAAASGATRNVRHTVLDAIQRHGTGLRQDARNAVATARTRARDLGREQLASDIAPIRSWALRNLQVPPPSPGTVPHAAALDAFEADRVASSIHAAWGSALLSSFLGWEKRGERGNVANALDVGRILAPRLAVHAATQAASAYADERQSYWDRLAEPAPDFGGIFGPTGNANDNEGPSYGPALFHVWSSVLDERTCEDCAALDGTTVPIDEDFEGGAETPLHPNCRCVILTTFDEGALDGGDSQRTAVGDLVRTTTLPSIMRLF